MSHCNTIFHQLLKLIPRHEFEQLSLQHHSGRTFRTLSRWTQFTALLMGQLSGRDSLRDIVDNLGAQAHRLYHLGSRCISRSSLSRLNNDKSYALYEALFGKLLTRCRSHVGGHRFRFKNALYSLDASTIDLCLSAFPWADFRSTKAGIKCHVGLNHAGYLPEFITITEAKVHDVIAGRQFHFPKGSIVVMDKGYTDYTWYKSLNDQQVYWITRLKKNARYRVVARANVLKSKGITSDQAIEFTGIKAQQQCPIRLRRIGYTDEESGKHYTFLTNNFKLAAKTIAELYKDRWQVELFFKWIKQNLKIKSFLGTSKNAVMTQVWVAMCAYLLICYQKFMSKLTKSPQQLLRLLQLNLFERRNLIALFKGDPPDIPSINKRQMILC